MVIYGVAALAVSLLIGIGLGQILGWLLGIDANLGGVGLAMLILVGMTEYLKRVGRFGAASQQGIFFWNAMYIPIVVAMATKEDVRSAISGGPIAIFTGVAVTLICFALVPVFDRIGRANSTSVDAATEEW